MLYKYIECFLVLHKIVNYYQTAIKMQNSSNSPTSDQKLKPYTLEKPDNISKFLVLNLFKRAVGKKQQRMLTFLQNYYLTSVKLAFLSIRLHSIQSVKLQKFCLTLQSIQSRAVLFYFSDLIKTINKHSEILKKSSQLEKLLKSRQQKKLKNISSDHLSEFAFNIIKRIISSVLYKNLFSAFTMMKFKYKSNTPVKTFKRFLCLSLRNVAKKYLSLIFSQVYLTSAEKTQKNKKIGKIFSVYLKSLSKVWEILRYFEKTPKYFLSNQWKYNCFNPNMATRGWKKLAIDSLFHILNKKLTCLMCFSFCKLSHSHSNPWSNTISPLKLSNTSTDDSNVSILFKRVKLQDILGIDSNKYINEKFKFVLLRLFEVINLRLVNNKKFSFSILLCLKNTKLTPKRISCKDLPICRKLTNSVKSLTQANKPSLSPFRKYNKLKKNN